MKEGRKEGGKEERKERGRGPWNKKEKELNHTGNWQ